MAGELVGGAFLGAFVSEGLTLLIAEVKAVLDFEPVSKELASTMEDLLPIVKDIESLHGDDKLKTLMVTIDEAKVLVKKCLAVKKWNLFRKNEYTKEVWKIQKDMLSFFQLQLQLLLFKNQAQFKLVLEAISNKLDRPSVPATHVFRNLCSVRKPDKALVGFDVPLNLLTKKLVNDSVSSSLLVFGAPGCGKTSLVTHLCHNKDIKEKFKHIFFNVVSSTPNFRGIVQNLFQHEGYEALTFYDNSQAIVGLSDLLHELKEDGPILMVLDDVWPGAESLLKDFRDNIPFIPNFKILVTSRSYFQDFSFTYDLKPLKENYAKDLLMKCASRPDEASQAEYDFYLEKILKRCNGFPLVIEVVGSSLKGKPKYVWKGQVDSWSLGETILHNASVLACLEPSFYALNPHTKECFMDMGSFLEDQKIRASVIIDIRVELGGLGGSSSTVYMKYLNDLSSHNMLTLIPLGRKEPEDGFYNDFLVTQHDVLRELAIRQSELKAILKRKRVNLEIRGDNFPDWCFDLKKPINARLMSISTDDQFSSNWVEMDCPYVEALVLNISSLDYALPKFISTMKKLKVLVIINHGLYPARLSNFSCLSSLPNLKRIRLEKISITFLDIIPLQCRSLKKLSFVMCSFGEVFYDTEEELGVFKAPPSLEEIDIDYCYDLVELPFWVSEVVSLKTLSITNCNKLSILPEDIGNLSKLEVLRVCSCICLSELPETTERLNNLRFLDISGCFQLEKLPPEIGNLKKLKKISMRNCYRCNLPNSMKKLEDLEVKCDEGTTFLWERFKPKMKNLTIIEEETEHNLNSFL
ncbi:hypothetical protein AALP_AA8G507000 [Arabis alpina]|uniref:RPW8 domain-containing protein n=1 Tax=Arabis alpina TaxID=50452 RepID=A0A087GES2_ARAAL|nr:hypothetical protein AALP_AA8G507000 [Arabis alpina]